MCISSIVDTFVVFQIYWSCLLLLISLSLSLFLFHFSNDDQNVGRDMPYFVFAFRGVLRMWRSCWDSSCRLYRNTNLSRLPRWVPSLLWPSVCLNLAGSFLICLRRLWLYGLIFVAIVSFLFLFECQRDWTLIPVEYSQHFVIIHFDALVSQNGHICLARYVGSSVYDNWNPILTFYYSLKFWLVIGNFVVLTH